MNVSRSLQAVLVLNLLFSSACGDMTYEEKINALYHGSVPLIKPDELKKKAESEKLVILDTRSPEEFVVSHIDQARLIDYDHFKIEKVESIPKNAEIIVYCSVGYRSEKIGEELLANGFTNVKNLYGGIFQWKNEGLEVVDRNNQPTDSVHTYNRIWSLWLKNGIKVYD